MWSEYQNNKRALLIEGIDATSAIEGDHGIGNTPVLV
jgi:hypothetical protein